MSATAVHVHPDVVDLGDHARGAGRPLRAVFTVSNDGKVAVEMRIVADAALGRAFAAVAFGVVCHAEEKATPSAPSTLHPPAAAETLLALSNHSSVESSAISACNTAVSASSSSFTTTTAAAAAAAASTVIPAAHQDGQQAIPDENENLMLDLAAAGFPGSSCAGENLATISSTAALSGAASIREEFIMSLGPGERVELFVMLVPATGIPEHSGLTEAGEENSTSEWRLAMRDGESQQQLQYALEAVQGSIQIIAHSWNMDDALARHASIESPLQQIQQNGSACEVPCQQEVMAELHVRGRSCTSYIYPDQRQLQFGACTEGRKYARDFSVWNASEIDTYFIINPGWKDLEGLVEFTEYDTGDRIAHNRIPLSPHGQFRIRILLHAKSSALLNMQDDLWFSIENIRDARNVTYVRILLFCTSEPSSDGIEISSGEALNFGDCYAWEPVYRNLTLRNNSQELVTISLSSTIKEQVAFELIDPTSTKRNPRPSASSSPSGRRVEFHETDPDSMPEFDTGPPDTQLHSNHLFTESGGPPSTATVHSANASGNGDSDEQNSTSEASFRRESSLEDIAGTSNTTSRNRRVSVRNIATKNFVTTEHLEFQPGQSRYLRVWYTPVIPSASSSVPDYGVGRLNNRSFHLLLRQPSRDTRFIPAEARVCESIVSLSASDLNLGDCSVLQAYSGAITLFNLSDLTANVEVICESKAITPASRSISIKPRQSFDLALTFIPRKPNPDYMKQIVFLNLWNRHHPECMLTVRSRNLDERRISVHAVFYKILDPSPTNEINFGRICPNYPAIRAFRIQNVTDRPLLLGFDQEDSVATFVPWWNLKKDVAEVPFHERENYLPPRSSKELVGFGQAETFSEVEKAAFASMIPFCLVPPPSMPSLSPYRTSFVTASSDFGKEESPREAGISRTLSSLLDTDVISRLSSEITQSASSSAEKKHPESTKQTHEHTSLAEFFQHSPIFDDVNGQTPIPLPRQHLRGHFLAVPSLSASGTSSFRSRDDLDERVRTWTELDFKPLTLETKVFSGIDEETQCAEEQLRPGRSLYAAVVSGLLVRACHIALAAGEESVVCVSVTPDDDDVERRAINRSLRIKLLEFDKERLQRHLKHYMWRGAMFADVSFDDPPSRELVLSIHVRKSPVRISPMQSLNFGVMTAGSQKQRSFSIDNTKSNACLVFSIRKSRSVASGDVRVGNGYDSGRLGIVRPFSATSIPFMFRPSLAGDFLEVIEVVHEMDAKASQTLTIKAKVQKRSNFHLDVHTPLDFGLIYCGIESSHVLKMELSNDSDKTRVFSVAVVDRSRSSGAVPLPKVVITLLPSDKEILIDSALLASSSIANELREKQEKLATYTRKGKAAKAGVLKQEVKSLQGLLAAEMAALERAKQEDSKNDETTQENRESGKSANVVNVFENKASFAVSELCTQTIEVRLLAPRARHLQKGGNVDAYERTQPLTYNRAQDTLGSADNLDILTDRCEAGIAGYFKFTLGVFETKNREHTRTLNCFAQIAQTMNRSESTSSASELIIPADDDVADPERLPGRNAVDGDLANCALAESENSTEPVHGIPRVDFGNVQLGVTIRRAIQLRNMSDEVSEYYAVVEKTSTPGSQKLEECADTHSSARLHVTGLNSPIPPGGQVTFYVALTLLASGSHSRMLILRSKEAEDHHGYASHYFPGEHRVLLAASCNGGNAVQMVLGDDHVERNADVVAGKEAASNLAESTLELGEGTFDPSTKFSIVRKVRVISIVDLDLMLTVGSNLPHQVMSFADESLTVPASNISLPARGSCPIWVTIAPRLRPHEYREGTVRNIIGGLLLEAIVEDGQRLPETTVRFVASVGSTPIVVDTSCVDLGSVLLLPNSKLAAKRSLHGSFSVMNRSVRLRAQYELRASTSSISFLGETTAVLQSHGGGRAVDCKNRLDASLIQFELRCKRPGLVREWVDVFNVLSPSLSTQVEVRAFADPGDIEWTVESAKAWEDATVAYVYRDGENWGVSCCGHFRWFLRVADGHLERETTLVPCAMGNFNVLLKEKTSEIENAGIFAESELSSTKVGSAPFVSCGPSFSLGGPEFRAKTVYVYPLPPVSITVHQDEILRSGRLLVVDGTVLIRREIQSEAELENSTLLESVLQQCPLQISYCESALEFCVSDSGDRETVLSDGGSSAPAKTCILHSKSCQSDIGLFGHSSGWRDEIVTSRLVNPTEAPLQANLEIPLEGIYLEHVIEIEGSGRRLMDGSQRFVIDARSTVEVAVRVSPRGILRYGHSNTDEYLSCDISIVNLMNPQGCLNWKICGRLMGPRMKFVGLAELPKVVKHLDNDRKESEHGFDRNRLALVLPKAYAPGSLSSSSSFSITNTGPTRIAVKILFEKKGGRTAAHGIDYTAEMFDVLISDHISGVELCDATMSPLETLSIRITAAYVGTKDESRKCDEAFRHKDVLQTLLGILRFDCTVSGSIEPAETVDIFLDVCRGTAFKVQPPEFSFSELSGVENTNDGSTGADVVVDYDNAPFRVQQVTLQNLWKKTNARFLAQVSGLPSGLSLSIEPRAGPIRSGGSVHISVALLKQTASHAGFYGTAFLLIFYSTAEGTDGGVAAPEPVIRVPIQIHIDCSAEDPDDMLAGSRATSNTLPCRSSSWKSGGESMVESVPPMLSNPKSEYEALRPSSLRAKSAVGEADEIGTEDVVCKPLFERQSSVYAPYAGNLKERSGAFLFGDGYATARVESSGLSAVSSRTSETDSTPPSIIHLKGCAQISGDPNRFELNCGQFSVTSEPYVRRLVVENLSPTPLEYTCVRIRPWSSSIGEIEPNMAIEEESWLMISRSGGILAPEGRHGDSQSLVLTLARDRVNVYSTYLIISTSDEREVKVIRISMEVIADGFVPGMAESYFSVICDGRGADSRFIDYSIVMFGQVYRHRSFVVSNESAVTLEFMLSDSLAENTCSELTFSLSNTVLRKTTRLTIAPKEKQRVFLLYRPMLELSDEASTDEIERVFYVRLNCRLVKDHQVNIKILSRCRRPSFAVSNSDFVFDCAPLVQASVLAPPSEGGSASFAHHPASLNLAPRASVPALPESRTSQASTPRSSSPSRQNIIQSPHEADEGSEWGEGISPLFATLTIRSKVPATDVVFVVKNNTRFFAVDEYRDVTINCDSESNYREVVIRPIWAKIRERAHALHRERYVEEHITIYNRLFPREFFWIRIRLAIGGAASEFSAVTHKRGFLFSSLEGIVARFLVQFGAFWAQFRRPHMSGVSSAARAELDPASPTDMYLKDSSSDLRSANHVQLNLKTWATFVASASKRPGYDELLFDMHYATDELVYYMLKSGSQSGFQLASMLYSYVFKHDVFSTFLVADGKHLIVPEILIAWVGQLGHFLSFFPDKTDAFRGLCELENRFRERIAATSLSSESFTASDTHQSSRNALRM